ncbi:MAG TPA: AraC family transcriptional regulator, partial [Ilumatobacteraceae bacterium]|nr:AraC family transcriptional regulator [Ilumatobacteraceae bacterium]
MPRRSVVIVAFDRLQPLDAVGPHEVFAGASAVLAAEQRTRPGKDVAGYDITIVSKDGRPITTESGLQIVTTPLPAARTKIDTLLIPGGDGSQVARYDEVLIRWIRAAAKNSRRVATVCSGAFIGAEAGLLDGRTVTTHWARAGQLAREYPQLTVDADPIYVQDGNVWTSAGVTAGIDLALAMVEADHGTEVAQTVARWMVMFLHRPGGQTQFAAPVWVPRATRSVVRSAQDHIDNHPADDHRLDLLADRAAMSSRHFSRLFTDQVGETPARYVERVRVEAARAELEST